MSTQGGTGGTLLSELTPAQTMFPVAELYLWPQLAQRFAVLVR